MMRAPAAQPVGRDMRSNPWQASCAAKLPNTFGHAPHVAHSPMLTTMVVVVVGREGLLLWCVPLELAGVCDSSSSSSMVALLVVAVVAVAVQHYCTRCCGVRLPQRRRPSGPAAGLRRCLIQRGTLTCWLKGGQHRTGRA